MKHLCIVLLFCASHLDDPAEFLTCSFQAHTPVGSVTGSCTTQSQPAGGFNARWTLTLTFDAQSAAIAAKLQPDRFYDLVRGQNLEDASFTTILPMWGDFIIKPDSEEYVQFIKSTAPVYETRPNEVTISEISNAPLTIQILFEERTADFDPQRGLPSTAWLIQYLNCFPRRGTNRPDGFSH